MDGIHDLGGKQGFGPIPINDNVTFQHPWEARLWGLSRAGVTHGITIDWFRHGIERMMPADYLTFPYFQKWSTNILMLLIDNGALAMDEAISGKLKSPHPAADTLSLNDIITKNRASATDFSSEIDAKPKHKIGDTIKTKRQINTNHTRLPAYARGASGTIIAHHKAHWLPDAGAKNTHKAEHLYTVEFTATELWGTDDNDTITLDLWESYFV